MAATYSVRCQHITAPVSPTMAHSGMVKALPEGVNQVYTFAGTNVLSRGRVGEHAHPLTSPMA